MAHTKGPWKQRNNQVWAINDGRGPNPTMVAEAKLSWRGSNEADANARLIAAAPELLAACKSALDLSDHAEGCRWFKYNISELGTKEAREKALAECDCHRAALMAAVAKATGETP